MSTMTESEFKLLDLEFRTRASRLCRAKYQEVKMLLAKFLQYIERQPTLNDYIQSSNPNMTDEAVREMTDNVIKGRGRVAFDFGDDVREEVARQYRVLKYANEAEDVTRILSIGRVYNFDTAYQSHVEGFVHGVVNPFVDNINLYLHSIAMNICSTPGKSITINAIGDNAQVNISQDNSTLTPTQDNRHAEWGEIADELKRIRVAEEDIAELKDILLQERPKSKESLGGRLNQWIAKIVVKASQGLVDLTMSTASNVLAVLICKYYGL